METQLRSEEVNMVMECLRNAKRFHATVSFIADTGLNTSMDVDLDKTQESLVLIFGHINRKVKRSPYPIRRALLLVEAISRDFNDQLLRVLTPHRLPYTPYDTFDWLLSQTMNIFRTWDGSEKFIPIKVFPAQIAGTDAVPPGLEEAARAAGRNDWPDEGSEGTEIWVEAENAYNERVARVENQIIAWLCDRIGTARNANEMFRVFSKFNALYVGPKV
ncbi:hypothetical protein ID866_10419 [Astraeus odoratus]|nr:hypothetical protein ID866_10419 [Astraeus odoratus]